MTHPYVPDLTAEVVESRCLDLPCLTCGAVPGHWCATARGSKARMHAERWRAAVDDIRRGRRAA